MAKDTKDERHGVTLGFQGGGGLALRLTEKDAQALTDALARRRVVRRRGRRRAPCGSTSRRSSTCAPRSDEQRVGFGLG